jgi:hypothetical protein
VSTCLQMNALPPHPWWHAVRREHALHATAVSAELRPHHEHLCCLSCSALLLRAMSTPSCLLCLASPPLHHTLAEKRTGAASGALEHGALGARRMGQHSTNPGGTGGARPAWSSRCESSFWG